MSRSVLYMSMSLDGYIAGPDDKPGSPGGGDLMRLHEWFGFGPSGPNPSDLVCVEKSGPSQRLF